MFVNLIAATLCITYDAALVSPYSTVITLAATSTLTATSNTSLEITIAITNLYRTQLSLSFGLNSSFPPPLGNPQPTILSNSSSTQYVYLTRWAGRVAVKPNLSPYSSKIEGSFTSPPDVDISYVDSYSVPITCSS